MAQRKQPSRIGLGHAIGGRGGTGCAACHTALRGWRQRLRHLGAKLHELREQHELSALGVVVNKVSARAADARVALHLALQVVVCHTARGRLVRRQRREVDAKRVHILRSVCGGLRLTVVRLAPAHLRRLDE
eukprot:2575380-Prymnesium_polylepis.2